MHIWRKMKYRKEEGRVGRYGAKVDINRNITEASHRAKTMKLPSMGNWE